MARAKVGELELEYETFGDRGDPPVLLIMGLAMQLVAWDDRFCAQLAARGFFVVRFDNRDIGRSTWLDALGMPDLMAAMTGDAAAAKYSLEDMAADALGLLDALELPRAHLVGASMGGMIAQCAAIRAPARVASLVSIMSSTGHRRVGRTRPDIAPLLLTPPPADREEAIEHGVQLWRAIGSTGFPFDEAAVRERTARSFDRGNNPLGVARQLVAITTARDRTEALGKLDLPAAVVHGEVDPLIDRSGGEATAKAIRGARLILIPGMGHDLPEGIWPTVFDAITDVARRAEQT